MNGPGWEQQEQVERERWQITVNALDAARAGTATDAQWKWLARECGIKDYKPNAHARSESVG